MKKDIIAGGINGLLQAPVSTPATPQEKPAKVTGNYKIICTNIRPELAEKLEYIAYWDRKKKNAVINEALEAYVANWNPQQEKPKKF